MQVKSPILVDWQEEEVKVRIMDLRFWKTKEQKQVERIKDLMLKIKKLDPNVEKDYKKIKEYESEVNKMGKVILKDGKLQKVEDVPQKPQSPVAESFPNMAEQQQPNIEQDLMEEQDMPIPPMPVNMMRPVQPTTVPNLAQQQALYQQQASYAVQQQEMARRQQLSQDIAQQQAQQQQNALQQQMAQEQANYAHQQQLLRQQANFAPHQQFQQPQQRQYPDQNVTIRIVKVNGVLEVTVSMGNLENFMKNLKEAMDSQSSFDVGNRIVNGRHIVEMILNPEE
jgi:hypothetical protein